MKKYKPDQTRPEENETNQKKKKKSILLVGPRPKPSFDENLLPPVLQQLRLDPAVPPLALVQEQSLRDGPRVPPGPLRPEPLRPPVRVPHPLPHRALLGAEHLGHAGRVDPQEPHPLRREPHRGAVRLDEPPPLERVADDGEAARPAAGARGRRAGAPKGDEGEEDVLVRVEGALLAQDARVQGRRVWGGGGRGEGMGSRGGRWGDDVPVGIGGGEVGVAARFGEGVAGRGRAAGGSSTPIASQQVVTGPRAGGRARARAPSPPPPPSPPARRCTPGW